MSPWSPLVAIDTKNLALFGRGISGFVTPLLTGLLERHPDRQYVFLGPQFDVSTYSRFHNWRQWTIPWPEWLPRAARHPFYDNVLFPRAVARIDPQVVFSPYHDVLVPNDRRTRAIITIHDTCIGDLKALYPTTLRQYYLMMLRRNLSRAAHVITVSDASCATLIERWGVPIDKITVIPNTLDFAFGAHVVTATETEMVRKKYSHDRLIFYPGGAEWRKNIGRLVDSFAALVGSGEPLRLIVTGGTGSIWARELARVDRRVRDKVDFVGELTNAELKTYYVAADAVIYPSLCEGFGRVCMEAMSVGTPIACSDLPVLREVCDGYATYFDPRSVSDITAGLKRALSSGRCTARTIDRFSPDAVVHKFSNLIERFAQC